MSNRENLNLKKVDDPEIIQYLGTLPHYITTDETELTYDKEQLNNLKTSRLQVGEIRPIQVVLCWDDPYKDSNSPYRVHLRIANGRHRYQIDPNWPKEYYDITGSNDPYLEYHKLRLHFDMQKTKTRLEKRIIIKEVADHYCNNLHIPQHQVGQKVTEFFTSQGGMTAMDVSRYLSDKYKDPRQQSIARSKRKAKPDESKNEPTALAVPQDVSERKEATCGFVHLTDSNGMDSDQKQLDRDYKQENEVLRRNLLEAKDMNTLLNQKNITLHEWNRDMFQKSQKMLSSKAEVTVGNIRVFAEIDQQEFKVVIRTEEIEPYTP